MSVKMSSIKWNPNFSPALSNSQTTQNYTAMQARLIVFYARRHFLAVVKHTHPVTYPPYADSFFTRAVQRGGIRKYLAGNDDPVALLVEFGSHPRGGPTFTLGYRPLGHGVDAVSNGGKS